MRLSQLNFHSLDLFILLESVLVHTPFCVSIAVNLRHLLGVERLISEKIAASLSCLSHIKVALSQGNTASKKRLLVVGVG